ATTRVSALSLHDALPICRRLAEQVVGRDRLRLLRVGGGALVEEVGVLAGQHLLLEPARRLQLRRVRAEDGREAGMLQGAVEARRSEEHTSELQSRENLVC